MAASLTVSATGEPLAPVTVTGSGLAIATAYTLVITSPDGSVTNQSVTSDGSGAFTFTWVPQMGGSTTYALNASTYATVFAAVTGITAD